MYTLPEPKVLHQVSGRIRERAPHVDEEVIADHVRRVFEEYADSKVRDFLPILVEREVLTRVPVPQVPRQVV